MSKSIALTNAEAEVKALSAQLKDALALLDTANTRTAALEARIVVATSVFKAQRATIHELESKLATRGCIAPTLDESVVGANADAREAAEYAALHCGIGYIKTTPKAVVTTFTKRDGTVWEKTRIGNRASLREVTAHA